MEAVFDQYIETGVKVRLGPQILHTLWIRLSTIESRDSFVAKQDAPVDVSAEDLPRWKEPRPTSQRSTRVAVLPIVDGTSGLLSGRVSFQSLAG